MQSTSHSLPDRLQVSDGSAHWERLTTIYTPLLRTWLRRYKVPDADADDLIQEVFVAISKEIPEFDHNGRPGAFRSWLRQILVNRLRMFRRTRDRHPQAAV